MEANNKPRQSQDTSTNIYLKLLLTADKTASGSIRSRFKQNNLPTVFSAPKYYTATIEPESGSVIVFFSIWINVQQTLVLLTLGISKKQKLRYSNWPTINQSEE